MTQCKSIFWINHAFFKNIFQYSFNWVYIFVSNLFMSRKLFMHGSFEILDFYKFISVNMNLRGFCILMLMYNAG